MKKLSALVALVLCVTIGGVYAAWMYTGNELLAVEKRIDHSLEVPEFKTRVGVLEVESSTLKVVIDQTAPNNYLAELKITGEAVVRFTVNPGAPDEVVERGVDCLATLDLRNVEANLYQDSPIYKYNATEEFLLDWDSVEGETGVFTATITGQQIDLLLDLGDNFYLPTYEDYTEFNTLLNNIVLQLMIKPDTQPENEPVE